MRKFGILFLLIVSRNIIIYGQILSQDTIRLSLPDAEKQFLSNNLLLLAEKYNVEATRALIIQAKLYPNPTIYYTNTIYNTSNNNKYFDLSSNSDHAPQITQLIILAGKIKKQVKIAETNYKLAEDNFYDMLRTLKLGLRISFFNIYYLQQTSKVYSDEISSFKKVVTAYTQAQGKGYVSEADVVLIKAQQYSLESEYQALIDNINDLQSQLRILLQISVDKYLLPVVDSEIVKADPHSFGLRSLLDSAYVNRMDLLIATDNLLLSKQNYSLQKAQAVPDITIGPGFVKKSNFINNDFVYSIGFSLPLFNRNQGNIKNAKILIDYRTTQMKSIKKGLEEQVFRGFQKAIDADKLYRNIDLSFVANFDRLAKEILDQYIKRNINLLNFLTFYDSYKQNIVQLNTILFNKVNALENINFVTGTNFFNKY